MPTDDRILAEYLRRSYHAVDGLWFMKVEEEQGFEAALELDRRVWEVVAKVQARKARELLDCADNSPDCLARCFALKLEGDGHTFTIEATAAGVEARIEGCPWLELLRKAERTHLALQVAEAICVTEGETWCREFGEEYVFEMPEMSCGGAAQCRMRFRRKSTD